MKTELLLTEGLVTIEEVRESIEAFSPEWNPLGQEYGLVVRQGAAAVYLSALTPQEAGLELSETPSRASTVIVTDIGRSPGSQRLAREIQHRLIQLHGARALKS